MKEAANETIYQKSIKNSHETKISNEYETISLLVFSWNVKDIVIGLFNYEWISLQKKTDNDSKHA